MQARTENANVLPPITGRGGTLAWFAVTTKLFGINYPDFVRVTVREVIGLVLRNNAAEIYF
jgi:hypothetical protein